MRYYCICIAMLFVLVNCERNYGSFLRLRDENTFLQKNLHVLKPRLNKKAPFMKRKHKIFGGRYVPSITEFPFMAFMIHDFSGPDEYICSASVLTRQHLLTAAHCFVRCKSDYKRTDKNKYAIYLGGISIQQALVYAEIKNYFLHPKFQCLDKNSNCAGNNDIAVVKLKTKLWFSRSVNNVRLPPPSFVNSTSGLTSRLGKERCVVIGWGITEPYDKIPLMLRRLKVARVEIISHRECERSFSQICEFTQICNLDRQNINGSCLGDSGGPILCNGVQVGIVSYGDLDCSPRGKNVNTRVEYFVDWIKKITRGYENR